MTVYYKNNQLNKRKTIVSVLKYNIGQRLRGRKPTKIVIESSLHNFEAF